MISLILFYSFSLFFRLDGRGDFASVGHFVVVSVWVGHHVYVWRTTFDAPTFSLYTTPVAAATDTTIIPACPQPTGVMVVGMDMDLPAFPMAIHTRENTSLINDMDGVCTSGMMDESTMECLVKAWDTEGYVLVAFVDDYILLGCSNRMFFVDPK